MFWSIDWILRFFQLVHRDIKHWHQYCIKSEGDKNEKSINKLFNSIS